MIFAPNWMCVSKEKVYNCLKSPWDLNGGNFYERLKDFVSEITQRRLLLKGSWEKSFWKRLRDMGDRGRNELIKIYPVQTGSQCLVSWLLVAILVGEAFPYWKKWTAFRKLPQGWAEDKRGTKEAERSTIDIWRRIFSDSIGAAQIMCILKYCERHNGQRVRPLQWQETHRITLTNIYVRTLTNTYSDFDNLEKFINFDKSM